MLLGTKDELSVAPVEVIKFIEDMNENELASAVSISSRQTYQIIRLYLTIYSVHWPPQLDLPPGMTNLGNTCYMNATVQCLRVVPELRDAIKEFKEDFSVASASSATSIVNALKTVFAQMDGANTVNPVVLLHCLHLAFPQFAQTGENGVYRQQDANECWAELLRMLQQKLPAVRPRITLPAEENAGGVTKFGSIIDQFFGGSFDVEMKCTDDPSEPSTFTKENFLQLSCFISQEVKYMHSGLRSVSFFFFLFCTQIQLN